MDIELLEIRDFLQGLPIFRDVQDEGLESLVRQIAIRYLRRSSDFPPADNSEAYLYILRQGAVEMRNRDGVLLEKLAEGDIYNDTHEETTQRELSGHCSEDSLIYQLPCSALEPITEQHPELKEQLYRSRSERLLHASPELSAIGVSQNSLMKLSAAQLLVRPATTIPPETTAQQAAQTMTQEQTSAIVVVDKGELLGILTDKDLRVRLLANGRPASTPVREFMTKGLLKLDANTPAFEALMVMARNNIHHLPVLKHGKLIGLLSHSDLVRFESANAVYLVEEIRRSTQLDQLIELSRQLPEVQRHLVSSGISSYHLGWTLSSIVDTLTRQLAILAEQQLGPAPIPFCWLAVASLARRELTVSSDQDHALLLNDDYDETLHGSYFERFAFFITHGLEQCGFPRCPGEVMSVNADWRQSLSQWKATFERWIRTPSLKAMMLSSNFFDLRPITGDQELHRQLQSHILSAAKSNQIFLAHMAANANSHQPPVGFFRNFLLEHGGEHANTFDIKRRGTLPIVDIARLHALAAGLPSINTLDRLQDAAETGVMSHQGAQDLQQAFEFINMLRLRHQSEQLLDGAEPDNHIDPVALSALDRDHLKDSFTLIRDFQKTLEQRYQTARIG